MRLKNIYNILKEAEPIVTNIKLEKVDNGANYQFGNWEIFLKTIEKLKDVQALKGLIQELHDFSPIFWNSDINLKISREHQGFFNPWRTRLLSTIKVIVELLESVGYDSDDTGFEVKLPETDNFNDFAGNINDLNRVLKMCPFIRIEDSAISLKKTDIGSSWVIFTVIGGPAILLALAHVVQSAIKIKSMYITCEQQKEAVRGSRIKNDLAENISGLYVEMIKATASKEVEILEDELGRVLSDEERTSAEKSLETLGKLMAKGLEVYASLDAPQEARDVFPSVDAQKSLPEIAKLLTGQAE